MLDHHRLELRDLTRIPVGVFPEVQNPSGEIPIRQKAAYTVASLVIFLVGSNLPLYEVHPSLPPPIHYTRCTRPAHHPTDVRIGRLAVEHDIHGMSVKTGQHTVISDKIQSYYHQLSSTLRRSATHAEMRPQSRSMPMSCNGPIIIYVEAIFLENAIKRISIQPCIMQSA